MAKESFLHKYLSHLLPALSRATSNNSCRITDGKEIEKTVRFEVDMALVLSTSDHKWSNALRHKLEQGIKLKKPNTTRNISVRSTRPSIAMASGRRSNRRRVRREEELGQVVRSLRRILPGGNEMALSELLMEVESYVDCLELQVKILKFLVES